MLYSRYFPFALLFRLLSLLNASTFQICHCCYQKKGSRVYIFFSIFIQQLFYLHFYHPLLLRGFAVECVYLMGVCYRGIELKCTMVKTNLD